MTRNSATIVALLLMPIILPGYIIGFMWGWFRMGFEAGQTKSIEIGFTQKY